MINLVYVIMPIIAMMIGFYFGYRIGKDKEIPEVTIKTPTEIVEEMKENREVREFDKDLQDFMTNIDNYPYNQKEIK